MDNLISNEQKNNSLKLISIVALAVSIIVLATVILLVLNKNDYKKIENQMVKNAKEYISKNNINVTNQEYVFINDLDIENGVELCSKASGVIITNIGGTIKYYPYLKCVDYESKVLNNTKSYIELKGPEVILVNLGTLYSDEGYKKIKDDIKIETVGEVPNEVGAYTINYVVTKNGKQKTIVKRIVIVSKLDTNISLTELKNTEKPNIVLKGEKDIILPLNAKYEEPGYYAYDYKDGVITSKVKVESDEISTSKEGNYTITYTVKNKKGETETVKRNIKVVKTIGDLEVTVTTSEKGATINESSIEVRAAGNDFSKIILPNGEEVPYTIANYTVTSNGLYTFKIVDIYGNQISKSILVDNIDNKPPTGSCMVEKEDVFTIFNVEVKDENGVQSVDYILNGNETGFLATTKYRTKEKVNVANVVIKDVAGNVTRLSCDMKNIPVTDDNYTFKYDNKKPFVGCDSYTEVVRKELEAKLVQVINKAGNGTRAGVVEAARFLLGALEYKIPYLSVKNTTIDPDQILGRYDKIGLNIANDNAWGCKINGLTQGLDSFSFVKWAFINAGVSFTDEHVGVSSFENVNKIKPGDLLLTACTDACENKEYSDMGLVIGIDSNKLYVANSISNNGLVIIELDKNKMPKNGNFALVELHKYKAEGNLNNMWK